MSKMDMNRPLELADELIEKLIESTDNAADFLAAMALAIRRMQGYSDYTMIVSNVTLRRIGTKEEK